MTQPLRHDVRRRRGASPLEVDIYRVVLEAGEAGLTVAQIHEQLRRAPGWATATSLWWQGRKIRVSAAGPGSFDPMKAGLLRVKKQVDLMRSRGVLISDGNAGRGQSTYTAGEPPKGYRPRWVEQNPHGPYPIDVRAASASSAEQRDRIQWLMDVRAELGKDRPRVARLRELLETALRLIERKTS